MSENRCICCGDVIHDGRQVCQLCEARSEDKPCKQPERSGKNEDPRN